MVAFAPFLVWEAMAPQHPKTVRVIALVHSGDATGPVISSGSAIVSIGAALGFDVQPHIDLVPHLSNVADAELTVEIQLPPPTGSEQMLWYMSRGDLYTRGDSWGCFESGDHSPPRVKDNDYMFITYAAEARACPQIVDRVPAPILQRALANPEQVGGFDTLEHPHRPPGPRNPYRSWLTLRRLAVPYNARFNPLVFRAGCP
jgi:hypothetical protein